MDKPSLLIVEDDKSIALGLEYSLQQEGFEVTLCAGVGQALAALAEKRFQLAVLDLSLPDGSGYDICRAAKQRGDLPVIFLTARDDEGSVVMGLDMGADDYITKPFRLRELVSRIRSVLRRAGQGGALLEFGHVQVNAALGKVYKNGRTSFDGPRIPAADGAGQPRRPDPSPAASSSKASGTCRGISSTTTP